MRLRYFGGGEMGRHGFGFFFLFSILLSDNCNVFAVAVPLKKTNSQGCF